MGDAMGDYGMYPLGREGSRERAGHSRSLSTEYEFIRRERERLEARERELIEAATRFGAEPPVGSVVVFQKRFPDGMKTYSYAALRTGPERAIGAGWFLTGRDNNQPRTWGWLCDFIGDGPFQVVTASEIAEITSFKAFISKFEQNSGRKTDAEESRPPTTEPLKRADAEEFQQQVTDLLKQAGAEGLQPHDIAVRSGRSAAWVHFQLGMLRKANKVVLLRNGRWAGRWAWAQSVVDTITPVADEASKVLTEGPTLDPLAPYFLYRYPGVVNAEAEWQVRDRRRQVGHSLVVAVFAERADGRRRAEQSASDRNRAARARILAFDEEPSVGARIRRRRSTGTLPFQVWARRDPDGWTRFNGSQIQGVRLSWDSVRRQVGGTTFGIEWVPEGEVSPA